MRLNFEKLPNRALIGLAFAVLSACEYRQANGPPAPVKASSYDRGFEFGKQLALMQRDDPAAEVEQALEGLCDALAQSEKQPNGHNLCTALEGLETGSGHWQTDARRKTLLTMDDYAELNARREGVVVLPSSVQYEVLKRGNGELAERADTVVINYQGSLPDGKIFDTTYEDGEPLAVKLEEIAIPGLRQALLLMPVGSQWRVVIPPKMGFGRSGNNQLRRRDVIYEIELVAIRKPLLDQ